MLTVQAFTEGLFFFLAINLCHYRTWGPQVWLREQEMLIGYLGGCILYFSPGKSMMPNCERHATEKSCWKTKHFQFSVAQKKPKHVNHVSVQHSDRYAYKQPFTLTLFCIIL